MVNLKVKIDYRSFSVDPSSTTLPLAQRQTNIGLSLPKLNLFLMISLIYPMEIDV